MQLSVCLISCLMLMSCCPHTVAAPPDVTFVSMYFISCDSCFRAVAFSLCLLLFLGRCLYIILVVALSDSFMNLSCSVLYRPMYAWNLYFRSSCIASSPLNVGGFHLYLCTPATPSCCSVAIACVVACMSQESSLCKGSSPCSCAEPVALSCSLLCGVARYWSSPCRDHCSATMKSSIVKL